MKRSALVGSMTACFCFALSAPPLAAQPVATSSDSRPSSSEANASAIKPAEKCLADLHAFDLHMEKDGYWLAGSGYGYGYPLGGPPAATATGYPNARPGYEIRILVASANILARQGQQEQCEAVLATTRDIYRLYLTNIHAGKIPVVDVPGWRQQQIAAAKPVADNNTSFRSDELLGTEVRDPQNQALGSVEDMVIESADR